MRKILDDTQDWDELPYLGAYKSDDDEENDDEENVRKKLEFQTAIEMIL